MSTDNSSGASKILLAFFSGMAAGIAAGLYLNSEHGRKMRNEAIDKISELESKIEEKVRDAYEQVKNKAESLANNEKK